MGGWLIECSILGTKSSFRGLRRGCFYHELFWPMLRRIPDFSVAALLTGMLTKGEVGAKQLFAELPKPSVPL